MLLGLMPHGYCFLWNIGLTLLHGLSDGAIALAYFSIPTMMYFNRHRATDEVRPLILMFAAFILSCGIGHIFSAWNIWHGNYWLEGTWKVVTAAISLATAWHLRSAIPKIMGFHRQLSETELLANTDRLTGLSNRRGLEQALNRLPILETTPDANSHVLMLIDLDHFKTINDLHGHLVGDRLLQTVTTVLNRHTRSTDVVARIGGDEFVVILVGCSLSHGKSIAEDIRANIAQITLDNVPLSADSPTLVTASIGMQSLDLEDLKTFEEVFRPIDQSLYVSKRSGRNRVTIASGNVSTMKFNPAVTSQRSTAPG